VREKKKKKKIILWESRNGCVWYLQSFEHEQQLYVIVWSINLWGSCSKMWERWKSYMWDLLMGMCTWLQKLKQQQQGASVLWTNVRTKYGWGHKQMEGFGSWQREDLR
jgi:hypothetical protein